MTSLETHMLQLLRPRCDRLVALASVGIAAATSLGQSAGNGRFDLDRDGQITEADVAYLVGRFGPCRGCRSDLNADGVVDGSDLMEVAGHLGAMVFRQDAQGANADFVLNEALPMTLDFPANPPSPPPVPVSLDRAGAFAGANVHDLGAVPPERIEVANVTFEQAYGHIKPGPKRVGFVREFDPAVSIGAGHARFQPLGDGNGLWTLELRSQGASYLRAHFQHVDLGDSQLIVYGFLQNGSAVVKGPYRDLGPNASGEFWSATVPGESMRVEVVGPDEPKFSIAEVGHFDDPMRLNPVDDDGGVAGGPLGCHLDVMCEAVNTAARQATGHMTWVTGGNVGNCSGTLLNDLDSETAVPYFITAFHCLSTQAEVNTLEVVWFFQKDSCNGTLPDFSTLPSNSGGSLLVTNDTDDGNDMTFIRLGGGLPGGISFAGWTTASLDSGHGIHHPDGSWKRATWFDSSSGVCFDVFDYDYYETASGAIEGGSSGSGIFNGSGQLSGQLYGFCGSSSTPPCPDQVGSTLMYGEFESTWEDTAVSFWLTLGGTIWVWNGSPNLPGNGTAGDPFGSVGQANNLAWDGAQIKIIAGSYNETLTISKAVTVEAVNGTVVIGQ